MCARSFLSNISAEAHYVRPSPGVVTAPGGAIHTQALWLHVFVRAVFQQVPEMCLEEEVSFLNPTELPLGLTEVLPLV